MVVQRDRESGDVKTTRIRIPHGDRRSAVWLADPPIESSRI